MCFLDLTFFKYLGDNAKHIHSRDNTLPTKVHLVKAMVFPVVMYGCVEGLMLKLNLQNFGHLRQTADSLEKTLMLGKTEGRRRRG